MDSTMSPDVRDVLERLTRRLSHRHVVDGQAVIGTNGHQDLIDAFLVLGWDDPHGLAEGTPLLTTNEPTAPPTAA